MPSRDREAERKRLAKWRKDNPEKHSKINREGGWKHRGINMTVERYEKMVQSQNGKCLICQRKQKLVVDHSHLNGDIRGLLCNFCNRYVVYVAEYAPQLFYKAAHYLENYGTESNHTVEEPWPFSFSGFKRDKDSASKVG
jgi:hypothetical protein